MADKVTFDFENGIIIWDTEDRKGIEQCEYLINFKEEIIESYLNSKKLVFDKSKYTLEEIERELLGSEKVHKTNFDIEELERRILLSKDKQEEE